MYPHPQRMPRQSPHSVRSTIQTFVGNLEIEKTVNSVNPKPY
ncbi:hypothetical protein MPTK1_6g06210 [Marchantia polymorpha subsp. ruderalis]|uniref:Uncharacterized protein n=2 Tax=Marchantia polymorpha TaxID=3197 RepID=A0AAF6BP43_MARPO|nr:hypothetical protein MARPO_0097s0023 [Marchantia polymorpha]BBN13777.1 hypothetical protein Mp_6g06210 [Marchantia polymorpha subsp. ruderalis]|eukprot:PTQ32537.1 hypothetical protein MARPO_0097s0023 [Marchantia polymorpha]